jgi:hypothetical protein
VRKRGENVKWTLWFSSEANLSVGKRTKYWREVITTLEQTSRDKKLRRESLARVQIAIIHDFSERFMKLRRGLVPGGRSQTSHRVCLPAA